MSSWLITIIIQLQLLRVISEPVCEEVTKGIANQTNTCTYRCLHHANETLDTITITPGPGTTIIGDKWVIKPTSQQGVDLTVTLSDSWGLSSTATSIYEISLSGSTSTNTETSSSGTVIFIISAGDQYFAETISLGSVTPRYNECPSSGSSLITTTMSTMIKATSPDRYDRFCSNGHSWSETNDQYRSAVDCEVSQYTNCEENTWYQGFRFTNDPSKNKASYEWYDYHDILNLHGSYVSSHFSSSFSTASSGWTLYIAGTDPNDEFTIDSLNFFYQREKEV